MKVLTPLERNEHEEKYSQQEPLIMQNQQLSLSRQLNKWIYLREPDVRVIVTIAFMKYIC